MIWYFRKSGTCQIICLLSSSNKNIQDILTASVESMKLFAYKPITCVHCKSGLIFRCPGYSERRPGRIQEKIKKTEKLSCLPLTTPEKWPWNMSTTAEWPVFTIWSSYHILTVVITWAFLLLWQFIYVQKICFANIIHW